MGERGRGRRPMGRRGQGQDRRGCRSRPTWSCASRAATNAGHTPSSAARPTSCRCCPRASCGRQARRDRQRRRPRSACLVDEIGGSRPKGSPSRATTCGSPTTPPSSCPLPASSTPCARAAAPARASAPPGAASARPRGQGRPPRHPPHGSRRSRHAAAKIEAPARPPQRAAARLSALEEVRSRRRVRGARVGGAAGAALSRHGMAPPRRGSAAPAPHPVRGARKARCSTSTTALIRSSPSSNTVAGQAATAPASGPARSVRARHRPRTTRRGRGGAIPDRAVRRHRRAHRDARPRVRTVTGRKRRCGWFDACSCPDVSTPASTASR